MKMKKYIILALLFAVLSIKLFDEKIGIVISAILLLILGILVYRRNKNN
jgi:4-amino-4-deoxy-L-arabinose transferase-like glycosyltransferase